MGCQRCGHGIMRVVLQCSECGHIQEPTSVQVLEKQLADALVENEKLTERLAELEKDAEFLNEIPY